MSAERIWLVSVGEPLPVDGADARLFRIGLLHRELVGRGHDVLWWSSTFDHANKRHRFPHNHAVPLSARSELRMIHAPSYPRSTSPRRLLNHAVLGRRFRGWAAESPPPDAIVACMPTLELAAEAARYATAHDVPLIVDVRDQWPDAFVDFFPGWAEPLAHVALRPLRRHLVDACRRATAITATGQPFLEWALAHAGRGPGRFDRAIPLAYDATPPSPTAIVRANAFWDAHGVLDDGTFTVAFVGTMNSHCELDTAIEVARASPTPMRFAFCGTGTRFDALRRRAAGIAQVVMPGWVGRAQIWALLQRSTVGLAPYAPRPTFDRNLTNKMIEYLSAGLPIVTPSGGLLAELIETRGCGVRYAGDGLHDALRELADDPGRLAAMRRNAKAVYEERFQAKAVYGGFADLIEALAERTKEARWRA